VRLSYSKLNTYRLCPLRYRFTYLDRLPRRPRRLFRAARRIHHALMRWLTYARTGMPRWEDVEAAYNAAWSASDDPDARGSRDYEEGLQILRDYHEVNVERPCRPVLLEHKFSIPLGPHSLTGAIDRVDATDSGYEVIDYKLDRELRVQSEVDADLQLGLYHLAIQEVYGVSPEALTLYFLRHNVQRTTVRTPEQTAELARWAACTGNDIATDRQWAPCVGDQCGSCDFRSICPAHTGRPVAPPAARTVPVEAQLALFVPDRQLLPQFPSATPEVSPGAAAPQLALPLQS
jgi:RecB family exonuclease